MGRGNSFLETGGLAGGGGGGSFPGFLICTPPGIQVDEFAIEAKNGNAINLNSQQRAWSSPASLLSAVYVSASQIGSLEYGLVRVGGGAPTWSSDPKANPIVWGCADAATSLVEVWVRLAPGNEQFVETYVLVQDQDGVCPPP